MKKMKVLLITLLTGVVLGGCSTSQLSEAYDEETLKVEAQKVVNLIIDGEYDKIGENMGENLSKEVTKEELGVMIKQTWKPVKEKVGEFKSIAKEGVVGKDGLATVIEVVEFENGKAQFTITYNEEMKLEGLYIK